MKSIKSMTCLDWMETFRNGRQQRRFAADTATTPVATIMAHQANGTSTSQRTWRVAEAARVASNALTPDRWMAMIRNGIRQTDQEPDEPFVLMLAQTALVEAV